MLISVVSCLEINIFACKILTEQMKAVQTVEDAHRIFKTVMYFVLLR